VRHRLISLEGLLDYTREDVQERTFEVSLLAECLRELLARDLAPLLAAGIYRAAAQQSGAPTAGSRRADVSLARVGDKRKEASRPAAARDSTDARDTADAVQGAGTAAPDGPPAVKRARLDSAATDSTFRSTVHSDGQVPADAPASPTAGGGRAALQPHKPGEAPPPKEEQGSWRWYLSSAWRLFDTSGAGYLRVEDVESLLARTGDLNMSRGSLRALLGKVARHPGDVSGSGRAPPPSSCIASWRVWLADLLAVPDHEAAVNQ
jgi:hypothetical protein